MVSPANSIQSHVWRLIFIPTFTVIILIGFSLAWIVLSELNTHLENRGRIYAEQTAKLVYPSIDSHQFTSTRELLNIAAEELYIRAIHVSVTEGNRQLHQGPQFILSPEEEIEYEQFALQKLLEPTQSQSLQTYRFSHPITHHLTHAPIGWVEIEMITVPYQLVRSQTLAIIFIIVLLGLIIAAYLAFSLYFQIAKPLASIKLKVSKMAKNQLTERIEEQKVSEFQSVAESINLMADALSLAQQDMQSHVDQALEELQETLETIEVQNVQLDIARKEALEASRVKSEFLANTSHEIRTPLNGILGFVNLLAKSDINEKQRDYIDTIRDSAQHLLTVINGILDFSKIEAGKLTLDYAPLDIQACLNEVLHLLAPAAQEKNIQLVNYIDSKIPSNLLGDSLRLKQVFTNLVNNAVKYSSYGHVIIHIECLEKTESQINLKVKITDQGVGLSKEEQDSLFEPFIQIDSANNRKYDGTGLGLAICKGLVERMRGQIGVESQPNQGSTFWFTANFGIDKNQPNYNFSPELKNVKMLICGEDNPSRKQIGHISSNHRAAVEYIDTVHDCFAALRDALEQQIPFNMLLLDVAPDERKITPALLSNLSKQVYTEFKCPTLVCCTQSQQRLYSGSVQDSFVSFINKPIHQEKFFKTIASKLNIQEQQKIEMPLHHPSDVKILIVDDNQANLHLASELLKNLDFNVLAATSGPEAIHIFKSEQPDAIFMDIQMPVMDGIETTQNIRSLETGEKRTPIIALTAHSITDHKKNLLIAGMDDCLSKPINEAQFAHTLQRWLNYQSPAAPLEEPRISTPSTNYSNTISFSTEEEDELEPVDLALSLKLANNNANLACDLLNALFTSLPGDLERINDYAKNNELDNFSHEIHRLYGSSCYCGVQDLKAIAGTIDRLCHNHDYAEALKMLNDLTDAIIDILQWKEEKDIAQLMADIT